MNEIEFCIENYLNDNISFDEARELMNKDISSIVSILLKNKYILVIKENNEDIITIEFEYSNYHYNNQQDTKNPYWITRPEFNFIESKEFWKRLP